jgi:hypothetical protein
LELGLWYKFIYVDKKSKKNTQTRLFLTTDNIPTKDIAQESLVWGLVWVKKKRFVILAEDGYLTLFDSTHKTYYLNWKLFTVICRYKSSIYRSCLHFIISSKNNEVITTGFQVGSD